MPRKRRAPKHRLDVLDQDARDELELGYAFFNPSLRHGESVFASEAERRECWRRHRDQILDEWGDHPRRPWAERRYDHGEDAGGATPDR